MPTAIYSRRSLASCRLDKREYGVQTESVAGREWQRLADVVRDERAKRGMSQQQLADQSALSVVTVNRLENGRAIRPTSLAGLERGLGWRTGTARSVLEHKTAERSEAPPPQQAEVHVDIGALAAMLFSTWQDEGYEPFRAQRTRLRKQLDPDTMQTVMQEFATLASPSGNAHSDTATAGEHDAQ